MSRTMRLGSREQFDRRGGASEFRRRKSPRRGSEQPAQRAAGMGDEVEQRLGNDPEEDGHGPGEYRDEHDLGLRAGREGGGHGLYIKLGRATGQAKGASPFALVPGLIPTLWRPTAAEFVVHATVRGFMTPTWVSDVTPYDTGERLDVPGRLRVIATPGHSEGHASLLIEDQGILFTGDALANYDVLTRSRGVQLMPDALNGNPARTRQSLSALAKVDAETLLFGHGDPYHGSPADAVARAQNQPQDRS